MRKRILSGMRPTGPLHVGHLLGALNNWVKLQKDNECLFMIADWHALMSEYEAPEKIREYSLSCVADWIGSGIDPEKSIIFRQSDIKEHLELAIIFGIITPLGWLERCPTYKEQLRELKTKHITTYGFLGYPVLQAADILVYKADAVPVGEDQLPHLELTREIARKFNGLYKKTCLPPACRTGRAGKVFPEPEALLTKTARILGIDGRKMSKSYDNFIGLSESPDVIKAKVARMFTDPKRIKLTDKGHPDKCNVFSYYKIFACLPARQAPEMENDVRNWCENALLGCTECKARLAERLIDYLKPIREKSQALLKDKKQIEDILTNGSDKARQIASQTISEVKKAIGL